MRILKQVMVMGGLWLPSLAVADAQQVRSVSEQVDAVANGTVRLSFEARAGVCGNGSSWIRTGDRNYSGSWNRQRDLDVECESGPVRVVVERASGRTVALRTYVGGRWRTSESTRDLGDVSAASAVQWLLREAASAPESGAKDAFLPLTIAHADVPWMSVLDVARDALRPRAVRSQAVFWAAQAAGDKAADEIGAIASNDPDREVRTSAVFALSRRDDGFDQLVRIARTSKDRDVKQSAFFWLGQSKDLRAAEFLAEVLSRP
jgi:hypothetical protein